MALALLKNILKEAIKQQLKKKMIETAEENTGEDLSGIAGLLGMGDDMKKMKAETAMAKKTETDNEMGTPSDAPSRGPMAGLGAGQTGTSVDPNEVIPEAKYTPQLDVGAAPPRGVIGGLQSAGYSILGKPIDMENRGIEAYIGKLPGDILRSRIGVATSDQSRTYEANAAEKSFDNYMEKKKFELSERKYDLSERQFDLSEKKFYKEKEPKVLAPTWKQNQMRASIRSGIGRGKVVIGKEFGEPEEFDIKTNADALRAIELGGFDPQEPYWKASLEKYPAPKVGSIIDRGGKKWRVVGVDDDGVPLVEEAK